MAFHVACPITCRRICHCSLGFSRTLRTDDFLLEVSALQEFLTDPWGIRVREASGTVQVAVPKLEPPPLPPPQPAAVVEALGASDGGDDSLAAVSAQAKRVALQKKAAAAMVAAEDYARRFESGDLLDQSGDLVEEQGLSNSKILCRMCLFGESEGSERAKKMLPCKTCGKKYHRSCLKNWSQNRDLFHWSSWTCPSCRMCEICRRTGDPKKFMFCKRCDGAYHCYCQHPPHKNVSSGPYLCPKHTKCHSCASNVPGNGLSVRWFLGYTCCDACGRLFVKGNYCPVCLKVYRDSEATPMVCCDLCQRWVHTDCDGISDEKYLQFQVDGNLQYVCATCRGESYQVKDLEDAVQELWRRKDTADRDLIASLRAAAGLPTEEEIFSISPYSDDDENGPAVVKSDSGRQLKLSFKGLTDKSPTKAKDGKKSSKKKNSTRNERHASSVEPDSSTVILIDDDKDGKRLLKGDRVSSFSGHIDPSERVHSINQPLVLKHKFIDDINGVAEDKKSRVVHIKSSKPNNADGVDTGKPNSKSKNVNEKKLVIHLGGRNKTTTNSPRSDGSSCQREHDLLTSNGNEDIPQQRANDKSIVAKHEDAGGVGSSGKSKVANSGAKEGNIIKLGKVRPEASDVNPRLGKGTADVETNPPDQRRLVFRKRSSEGSLASPDPPPPIQTYSRGKSSLGKQIRKANAESEVNNDHGAGLTLEPPKDSKPLLKLKFKNINRENQPSLLPLHDEEKSSIKWQRSKRKRPSPLGGKTSSDGDEDGNRGHQDNLLDEIMDANWILKKLGKDAIGKRVEVQQTSDNSWHKGVVTDIVEGTSMLSVDLDDGRMQTLELGKQGVRFVSQKQKRSKAMGLFVRM